MDQFLASLPRPVLAFAVLIGGFLLIVLFDPPQTVCDAQLKLFREAQQVFLYASKDKNVEKPALIKELIEICQHGNSAGSCFDLFQKLKKMTIDLENVPKQCSEAAAKEPQIQQWLWKSMKLMVEIAWGDRGVDFIGSKHSWFDSSDVALFCTLKDRAQRLYGKEAFEQWRESVLTNLPKTDRMTREQIWQKSIFSTSCGRQ